jgi:hypothetical protein
MNNVELNQRYKCFFATIILTNKKKLYFGLFNLKPTKNARIILSV